MRLIPDSEYFDVSKAPFWRRFAVHNFERRKVFLPLWIVSCPLLFIYGFFSELVLFQILGIAALLHVVLGLESKAVLEAVEKSEQKAAK